MKDMTDLFKRFDQIQDPPISEELLGAYLENRLDEGTKQFVENEINKISSLADLVDDSRFSDAINDELSLCDTNEQIDTHALNDRFDTNDNYNDLIFDQAFFDDDFIEVTDSFIDNNLSEIDDILNSLDNCDMDLQDML